VEVVFEHPWTVALVAVGSIPLGVSVWALLDATRRPQWAWSLAERSQVAWIAAILFGILSVAPGLAISTWYLAKVRPVVADAEDGRF
jgi:hypothetical protein